MVVGGRKEPRPGAIARVGAKHEPAIDIAQAGQARGIVLIAAEAPAGQRTRLEAVPRNQAKAHVIDAADVDGAAAALTEAGRGNKRKAQDVVRLGALELGGNEHEAADLPGRAGQ